ncbi:hypothetical protein MKleb_5895 (plasmid) [Klebsiella sp. PL-2018]|nr:hypothetical protein MKleb_5821 [Klebsiella sp. PL-2018]QXD01396.1 hypothetical protein MKleb_5895 [Klebsiella sp. PL-2018]
MHLFFTYFRYEVKYTFPGRKNLPCIVNTVNRLTVKELTVSCCNMHAFYMYYDVHFSDAGLHSAKRILLTSQ